MKCHRGHISVKQSFPNSTMRSEISYFLNFQTSVALTTDAWSSRATMSFITTITHFIFPNWTLEEQVLETLHMPKSHNHDNIGEALYITAQKWGTIKPHTINAVVTDNAPVMPLAVAVSGLDPHLGCFVTNLNLCAQKGLEGSGMSKLLSCVRRMVTYFHKSNKASQTLK